MKTKKKKINTNIEGLNSYFDVAGDNAASVAGKKTYTSFEELFNDLYGQEAA